MNKIDFKNVVILKRPPYFIHCLNQEDAEKVCEKYFDEVVGVACSDSNIAVKSISRKVSLVEPEEMKLLEENIELEITNEQILEKVEE